MRRLYLHIYAALLFSLLAFAVLAGIVWRYGLADPGPRDRIHMSAALAEIALPSRDSSRNEVLLALNNLRQRLGGDLTLFTEDGRPVASVGRPVPFPRGRDRAGLIVLNGWGTTIVNLPDGRVLVLRRPAEYEEPVPRFFLLLGGLVLAVGVGSYPLARRLTRRIEALKDAVDAFGAGDLGTRVAVSGKDEVAALSNSFNCTAERIESLLSAHKTLLANASHELRSPLARLRMAIELLRAHADPKLQCELERNIAELDDLVGEILVASRLDALDGPVGTREVDLLAIAAEECAHAGALIEGVPVTIQGDARLVRRLVRNLLDNARRHGGGSIEASLERRHDQSVVLSVCDRGPGVPKDERERIFEPFYRPAGTREGEGGAGLGLALARQIARRHGADVQCLSRLGGGSIFEVAFPLARVAPTTPAGLIRSDLSAATQVV
jgi:signal transduction histidine kinase